MVEQLTENQRVRSPILRPGTTSEIFSMMNFLSQIDPKKLLQKDYIFQINPYTDGFYKYLGIIFGLMLVAAVILIFKKPREIYRKLNSKLITLLLIIGFFGLALIFFRFEAIPYLGSRLMLLILFLAFLVWGISIIYYWLMIMPREIKKKKEREDFEKYLPGGKERK